MAVPLLSYEAIAARADEVFRVHNPDGLIPVDVEHILDVGYGIDIYPRSGMMDRFQIDAFISADLKEIVIDQRIYEQRPPNCYRLSLAHEFAHLVLHAEFYRSLKFLSAQEWKASMAGVERLDYDRLEWQANTFAGLLLAPAAQLHQRSADIRRQLESAALDPLQLEEASIDRIVRMLAQQFAVPTQVIEHRLRKERLWPLI